MDNFLESKPYMKAESMPKGHDNTVKILGFVFQTNHIKTLKGLSQPGNICVVIL